MCTVSFYPLKDGFCITSNRDEKITRQKAIPPQMYCINNKEIFFPKDPNAGGTWFAHDHKNAVVLLNGAQEKHQIKEFYKKSRGIILLEIFASTKPILEWQKIDLNQVEPFTIILFSENKLFQLQWNETDKSTLELDISKSYIWSSSTLYSKEIRDKREQWFSKFILQEKEVNAKKLLHFHQFTENNNKDYGLQISRNNLLKTVSVTQCYIQNSIPKFTYIDLFDS